MTSSSLIIAESLPSMLPPIRRGSTPLLRVKLRETVTPAPIDFESKPLDLTGGLVRMRVSESPDYLGGFMFEAVFVNDADPLTGVATRRLTAAETDYAGKRHVEFLVVYTAGARAGQTLWAGTTQIMFRQGMV